MFQQPQWIHDLLYDCNNVCNVSKSKLGFFSFVFVTGIQGYRIHLDNNGDAQFNLTLLDIRKKPGTKIPYGKL